jgi:hypothetical protein
MSEMAEGEAWNGTSDLPASITPAQLGRAQSGDTERKLQPRLWRQPANVRWHFAIRQGYDPSVFLHSHRGAGRFSDIGNRFSPIESLVF